jgi:hypothetical protein
MFSAKIYLTSQSLGLLDLRRLQCTCSTSLNCPCPWPTLRGFQGWVPVLHHEPGVRPKLRAQLPAAPAWFSPSWVIWWMGDWEQIWTYVVPTFRCIFNEHTPQPTQEYILDSTCGCVFGFRTNSLPFSSSCFFSVTLNFHHITEQFDTQELSLVSSVFSCWWYLGDK